MPSFASHDGTVLAYRLAGAGPSLTCLAGGPGADVRTLGTVGGLDRGRRLVLLDARASGASELPTDRLSCAYTEQSHDVEALRGHLGLERMDLLAHSAGALTAQHYAATFPARVRRLVLVSPAGRIGREVDEEEVALLRARHAGKAWYAAAIEAGQRLATDRADPHEREGLESKLAPFRYGVWSSEARRHSRARGVRPPEWLRTAFYAGEPTAAEAPMRLAGLRAVGAPILVVAGAEDCIAGTRPARLVAACCRSTRLEILPGAGHHPWVDAPERFLALVADFLAG